MKTLLIAGGVAALLVYGCASQPSRELMDARAAYKDASNTPGAPNARQEMYDAKKALDSAEAAYQSSPGDQETVDLAYIAQRKAIAAKAIAIAVGALDEKKQAQDELAALTAQHEAASRRELASAKGELAKEKGVSESERQARVAADERTRAALDKIAGLTAKQEERGLVLTLSGSVVFKTGKSDLLPTAQQRLGDIAAALKDTDRSVVIVGHTDSVGNDEQNMALSRSRAESVRSFVVTHGVPADRVRAEGMGKTQPIADNATAEGRANNRRVEIVLENAKK
ncbi:MAG TPA: OmpA family protein [Labilithrix sp.]